MSLAIQGQGQGRGHGNGNGSGLPAHPAGVAAATSPVMTLDQVWQMAEHIAASGLFATKTPEQAFALMMLAQSEGLHCMQAMRRYHIIQGRPVMRSDATQAEFQRQGGRIKPICRTRTVARAVFSHPDLMPDGIELETTFEQYKAAGLTGKDVWKNYPDDMLWARLVTKGIRTVMPGIIAGIYSAEETDDILASESPAVAHARMHEDARKALTAIDLIVPGWDAAVPDVRPYHQVVADAVAATNAEVGRQWGETPNPPRPLDAKVVHGKLAARAVNLGHDDGAVPTKVKEAITLMSRVYASQRQWVRAELGAVCGEHQREAMESLEAALEAAARPEDVAQDGPEAEIEVEYDREPGEEG